MPTNPFSEGLSVRISGETGGLESALSRSMSKLGDFRTEVGLAGMAVGTVFAGGVVKAVDAASDWEDAMADVKKVTDAETAEELSGGFQDLSEEIPIAASELATIGEQAGKFGAEGSEDIMSFVETVGKIQTATDLTAEEAGKRFAKIAGAVGMPLDEVGKLGNATNALADSMKTDANEITDTATRSANTLSQQLGLGEDAVLALSASMNEVSPSSRIAASSLKRAAESLMDPKKVDDVAGALGMTSDEFKTMRDEDPQGLMKKVAKAMEENGETADELRGILGKAATDFSKLGGRLDATAEAQDKANQQFEDGTSLQEEMEIRTNTFSGQMQMLKDRIRNVGITIGEQFLPYLTTLMGHVSGAIERFASLNEKTDDMLGAVTLAAGAIGGFGVALAALVGGPITLAIGAIALLATAWAMGWEDIKVAVSEGVDRVTELLGSVMDWLAANGPDIADRALQIFETMLTDIAVWIKENGPGLIGEAFELVGKAIRLVAIDLYNAITGNEDSLIKSLLKDAASWIAENGPGILKGAAELAVEGIIAAFKGLYRGLLGNSLIPEMFNDIAGYIKNNALSDLASAAKSAGKGLGSGLASGIKSKISSVRSAASRMASAAKSKVSGVASSTASSVKSSVSSATSSSSGGLSASLPSLPSLDSGGFIESEGLAMLHAGEQVVPAADVRTGGGGDSHEYDIEVNIDGDASRQDVKRGVSDALRAVNATR